MKRILIASIAVLGFAGVAAAQQAPILQGDYSAAVLNAYNGSVEPAQGTIDYSSTASVGSHSMSAPHTDRTVNSATDNFNYAR